jgi:hypothetical protein
MNRPDDAQAYKEASIEIAAPPEAVYDLVSDLTRMGEWSPESTGGRWSGGGTGQVGDWFEGHNQVGEREWTRESQVARADRGRDFTFVVGGVEENCTWWSYEMAPTDSGTTLTEKWWFVNKTPGLASVSEEQVQARIDATQGAIEATIAAVKATAEAG